MFRLACIGCFLALVCGGAGARPVMGEAELAALVEQAYRTTPYLEMRVSMATEEHRPAAGDEQPPAVSETIAHVRMAPERYVLEVFEPREVAAAGPVSGQEPRELEIAITLNDGRVTEYRPSFSFGQGATLEKASLSYSAPRATGIDSVILRDLSGRPCVYGVLLDTWVGESSLRASRFAAKISASKVVGSEEVDGRACFVTRLEQEDKDPASGEVLYRVVEQLYVDCESYLVRRWVTTHTDVPSGSSESRVRHYAIVRSDVPPGEALEIGMQR